MTDSQKRTAAARRGRPRDAGVDEAILRAGWDVLAEAGYAGLTFEAVAERAGCSRPALYRRFTSRRDLVLALIEAAMAKVEPFLAGADNPRRELVEHTRGLVQYLIAGGGAVTTALAQARRSDPTLAEDLDALLLHERAYYEDALNAAVGGGDLTPAATRLLIDTLLGTVMFRVALCDQTLAESEIEILVDRTIQAARRQIRGD